MDVTIHGPSREHSTRADVVEFEAFFRLEQPRLLAVAVAYLGDREVARDLVQEALLKAYRAWPAVAAMERPGAWARRVLINLATDVHRRRGREQSVLARAASDTVTISGDLPSPALLDAIRALPRLQRAAVALHYFDDLSVAEVADVLEISTGSVKTSLSRARATLAPVLAARTGQEVER